MLITFLVVGGIAVATIGIIAFVHAEHIMTQEWKKRKERATTMQKTKF